MNVFRKSFLHHLEEDIKNIISNDSSKSKYSELSQSNKTYPCLYNLYIVNNCAVPTSFFVFILKECFHIAQHDTVEDFKALRKEGHLSYGLFTKDVAESKIAHITKIARNHGYILKCLMCKDTEYVVKKPGN